MQIEINFNLIFKLIIKGSFFEIFIFCSEFDKYNVFLGTVRKQQITKLRDDPTSIEFKENLEPGKTYTVTVKTVSGKVSSWPTTADVTLSEFFQFN